MSEFKLIEAVSGNGWHVALTSNGSEGRILTSLDAFSWTECKDVPVNNYVSVNYWNGVFVVVADNGDRVTLYNDTDWSTARLPFNLPWKQVSVESISGIPHFVISTTNDNDPSLISLDGVTWELKENVRKLNDTISGQTLNFIGKGAAFNTSLGNTSAFLKSDDGKNMMLIDCGEKVFSDLKKYRLLDGVENIHLYLTHLHPDHAGSLGTLIYYMYYMVKPMFQPKVFLHLPVDNSDKVIKYLNLSGVIYDTHYVFVPEPESAAQMFPNQRTSIGNIDRVLFVPQKHDKTLQCYGLLLYLSDDSMIYYSADASDISSVIINRIVTGKIREAYIDVSTFDYEDNIHLSHLKLKKIIDESLSEHTDKIFCMHLDDNWTPELTKSLGNGVREVKCIWER